MAEHSGKDVLSSDVEIKGSIKFQKELLIDGKVEGEINSEGVLTIGENADIRGLRSKPSRSLRFRQGSGEHHSQRALRIEIEVHAARRFESSASHY